MAEYQITFDLNSDVGKLYQALKKKGVKDADLDQGYEENDSVNYTRTVKGRRDKVVQAEEVLNYALEKLGLSPDEIHKVSGYIMPWRLDGKDKLAEEVKTKLHSRIAFFQTELKRAGYRATDDKFQELLAVSVFTYVMTSKKGAKVYRAPAEALIELRGAKLGVIADSILNDGGLGLADFEGDCDPEATALQALKNNCGMCTESLYVLYAAFKLAGLAVTGLDVKAPPAYLVAKGFPPRAKHTAILLNLKNRTRIFDSDAGRADAEKYFRANKFVWVQVSQREIMSMYYANYAINICRTDDQAGCLEALKRAQELNPGHWRLNLNLAAHYGKRGQVERAIALLKKAHAQNPQSQDIISNLKNGYSNMINANLERKNYAEALGYYRELVDLEPKNNETRKLLADLYSYTGKYDQANVEFQKLLKHNPNDRSVLISYSMSLANQGLELIKAEKYAAAQAKLRQAREKINLATKEKSDEKAQRVVDFIEKLQKFIPTNLP